MIININGWPGVGKLSVAERVVEHIGGRLLDNHTIFNVAFSLCEFRTPAFYETVRAVRDIAFTRVTALASDIPVILTSAYSDTPFGRENWAAIRKMADARGSPLCVVVLDCSLAENLRRLQAPERVRLRKLVDPAPLMAAREAHDLLETGGDHLLRFDTSDMSAQQSANRILQWLSKERLLPPQANVLG
jgi:AAA domain